MPGPRSAETRSPSTIAGKANITSARRMTTVVGESAEVGRKHADDGADERRREHRHGGDQERRADAVHDARQERAPELVGPEEELP
jgi:hypothetical protein